MPREDRTVAPKLCGAYVGDNDGTCPQLTCIRPKGHTGPHDNVRGDDCSCPMTAGGHNAYCGVWRHD